MVAGRCQRELGGGVRRARGPGLLEVGALMAEIHWLSSTWDIDEREAARLEHRAARRSAAATSAPIVPSRWWIVAARPTPIGRTNAQANPAEEAVPRFFSALGIAGDELVCLGQRSVGSGSGASVALR